MINLYDSNITDILPSVLSEDPRVQALGYAIQRAMQRLIDYCQNINIYASIDTVPEKVLDLLAVEFNTQYYDDTMDVEIKRSLIKHTLAWYTQTGTAAAVRELIGSVFGIGEVEEWFDYGGEPYHFRIRTYNVSATDEMLQLAENLVRSVQNVRSHLEEVIVEIMESMTLYIGCKAIIDEDVTLYCDLSTFGIFLVNEDGEQLVNEDNKKLFDLSDSGEEMLRVYLVNEGEQLTNENKELYYSL